MRCVERTAKGRVIISRKLTHDEFISRLTQIDPTIEPLENYKTALSKIKCRCKKCGYQWLTRPNGIFNGHGCPNCAGTTRKTQEAFIAELQRINPNIAVVGKYINNKTSVECKCLIDGYGWMAAPQDLLHGHGCPKCNGGVKDTKESFVEKLERINANVDVIGVYINSQTKIRCKCKICGKEWDVKPNSLLNGHGCPRCKSSHGERRISMYLDLHNITYMHQYGFDDCRDKHKLLFDFWLPTKEIAIEFQGAQHYHQSWYDYVHSNSESAEQSFINAQRRDEIKRNYCKVHDIKLIEIPYTELKNIEKVLDYHLL